MPLATFTGFIILGFPYSPATPLVHDAYPLLHPLSALPKTQQSQAKPWVPKPLHPHPPA
jgi:hypothetical protein